VAPVEGDLDVGALNSALVSAGVSVSTLLVEQPNLEDYFVGLTGEGFEVAR
jgi:ABC-2 type transport system ATP-binding protein